MRYGKAVSVCMATYNGSKFILEQIYSILNQLGERDEIVICDDVSDDNTIELIREIADSRIRLYLNEHRLGVVKNFEKALSLARNNTLFLSDQDDVWHPNKIKICVELLNKYDFVLSNFALIDNLGNVTNPFFFKDGEGLTGFMNNFIKNKFIGSCLSFNRNVLGIALPFPKCIPMHDWWIGLVASLYCNCYYTSAVLVSHRTHSANVSTTGDVSKFSLIEKLIMRFQIIKSLSQLKRR